MGTKRELPAARLTGAVLCASASLLLLLISVNQYAKGAGVRAAALPLVVGLGLLWAAVKSFGRRR